MSSQRREEEDTVAAAAAAGVSSRDDRSSTSMMLAIPSPSSPPPAQAKRRKTWKKRRDASVHSAADHDDGRQEVAKRPRTTESAVTILRDDIDKLMTLLHLSMLTVAYTSDNAVVVDTNAKKLSKQIAELPLSLLSQIPWRTFWGDVYVRMCETMHFFALPQRTVLARSKTSAARLFSAEHLEAVSRAIAELTTAGATAEATNVVVVSSEEESLPSLYAVFRDYATVLPAIEQNDKVYETMWCEMRVIASTYVRTIWRMIDEHTRRIGLVSKMERDELYDCLRLAYEMAMLRGHVLLAAPLSQFASLSTIQHLNELQMRQLPCINERYGLVFTETVIPTLIAAMQYSVLTRGLRPVEMWPLNFSSWPVFIVNHTALALHHFIAGLTGEALRCPNRDRGEIDRYANEYATRSAHLIASCAQDDYAQADDKDVRCLARYLNLVPSRTGITNDARGVSQMIDLFHQEDCRKHLLLQKNSCQPIDVTRATTITTTTTTIHAR